MLKFIGIGSAFNHAELDNAAYIKKGRELLLIDCGSDIFKALLSKGILEGIDQIYMVVTHLHPDHIGSLGNLIFYNSLVLKIKPLQIFYPDQTSLQQLLTLQDVNPEFYKLYTTFADMPLSSSEFSQYTIKALPQQHRGLTNAYGYLFTTEKETFFYSGDSKTIPKEILEMLFNGWLDVLYQDISSHDHENIPHLSYKRLLELIPEPFRFKVYCMHLDSAFSMEEAIKAGFNVAQNESGEGSLTH